MNLPLRARKRKISYREPSSDPDHDNESTEPYPTVYRLRSSSKRHRATDDNVLSTPEDSQSMGFQDQHTTSRRRKERKKEYAKPSQPNHRRQSRRATLSRPHRRALGAKRCTNKEFKSVVKDKTTASGSVLLQLGGRTPPWQTLPYEILLQVFKYAAYPLVAETSLPSSSHVPTWLLKLALLCKGFAEPALSALYYAPSLDRPSRAHKLLASLSSQTETSFLNYQSKIKYLDVEADGVLCRKYEGQEPIELGDLLSLGSRTRGINIYSLSDVAIHHKTINLSTKTQGKRAPYQSGLFVAIHDQNLRLCEWTWNGLLMRRSHTPLTEVVKYHHWKEFESMGDLTFFHFDRRYQVETIARSTSTLQRLRAVRFKDVTIENVEDLKQLSRNLEVLEFSNCASLDSLSLARLLASHGGNLRTMVLDHNDALDLTFLQDLTTRCPRLEVLKMDLRFFNTHVTFNDSEPKFEHLLKDTIVPSWPRTLQRIELFYLRKWDTSAAHTFFSSLVDAAETLPNLRHIDIKASIGESNWRDRINFRNKWVSRIERAFKRNSAPPDPRLRSLRTFKIHEQEFKMPVILASNGRKSTRDVSEKGGKSSKFSHVQVEQSCSDDKSGDSDLPLASKRRSIRLTNKPEEQSEGNFAPRQRRKRVKRKKRTSEDSSSEEDSALEDVETPEESQVPQEDGDQDLYIQGMCDVVRVAIDNLRPTEEHLDESYFLDDEISGDEDWNGDDDALGGGGYAW
ncbi:MAG: hypothetical protein L6R41_004135 [Letrouitia leprolyta]|nr:MAG: hypothetical protein L6R41_004135 [Letrouitia leprolyta]